MTAMSKSKRSFELMVVFFSRKTGFPSAGILTSGWSAMWPNTGYFKMCTGKSIGQAPFLHQHPPLKDSAHSMYSAVNSKATWLLINLASNWSKYRYYISVLLGHAPPPFRL